MHMRRPSRLSTRRWRTHNRLSASTGKVLAHSTQLAHHGDVLLILRDEDANHNEAGGPQTGTSYNSFLNMPTRHRRHGGTHDACATAQWSICARACLPWHTAEARPLSPLASAHCYASSGSFPCTPWHRGKEETQERGIENSTNVHFRLSKNYV